MTEIYPAVILLLNMHHPVDLKYHSLFAPIIKIDNVPNAREFGHFALA